jgi:DNA replication protein DnaC
VTFSRWRRFGLQLLYVLFFIALSTNRPLEDWGQLLGDTVAAGAILDRFLHHAEAIKLAGKSFRMHERQQRRASAEKG